MSIENEIQDLTQSTTDLLNAVNTKKVTLDNAVDTAEAAKTVATSKAAEATTVVADASTHATNAANSASQAAASAASASQIVTGVATGLPNIRPSLNLDFVNSKRVDPRIDFTRSTTATYYDGKTTAKAEENLHVNSTDLFNWADTTDVRKIANATTAPDGTTTAVKVYLSTGTNRCVVYQAGRTVGKTYTYSIYAKAGEKTGAIFQSDANGALTVARWDLSNGTNTYLDTSQNRSQSITAVGDGWYRLTVTQTANGVYTPWGISDNGTTDQLTANGTDGGYLWGPQCEERDSVTAYTPTTGTPITNYVPVLQTAAINEPRLDHDPVTGECKGLLMEGARTNLMPESTGSGWAAANLYRINNSFVAPNGIQEATVLQESTTANTYHWLYHGVSGFPTSGGAAYTASVYVKALPTGQGRGVKVHLRDGIASGDEFCRVFFNPTTEYFFTDANGGGGYEDVGNGWYRIWATSTDVNYADGSADFGLRLTSGTTSVSYAGDAHSGLIVWGLQLEAGSFPTSYIPTDGTAVTRSRDIAVMDNIDSWVNKSEATIFYKTEYSSKADKNISNRGIFGVYHTSARRASSFGVLLSNISARENWVAAGVSDDNGNGVYGKEIGNLSNAFTGATSFNKDSLSVAATNVLTGTQSYGIDTTTSSSLGSLVPNRAIIGSATDTAYQAVKTFNGCIECIRYYPQAMTQSELEALAQE